MSIKIERYDLPDEAAVWAFVEQHFARIGFIPIDRHRVIKNLLPFLRRAIVISSADYDLPALFRGLQENLPISWTGVLDISAYDESFMTMEFFNLLSDLVETLRPDDNHFFCGLRNHECRDLTLTYLGE